MNLTIEWTSFFLLAQKAFFVICSFLYLIFALIVVKQVTSMSKNITDKFNSILIIFSYVHLIFSVLLIILTLVIL